MESCIDFRNTYPCNQDPGKCSYVAQSRRAWQSHIATHRDQSTVCKFCKRFTNNCQAKVKNHQRKCRSNPDRPVELRRAPSVKSKVVVVGGAKPRSTKPKERPSATSTPKRDTIAEAMDLSIFADEDLTNFLLDTSVSIPDWEFPIVPETAGEKRPIISTSRSVAPMGATATNRYQAIRPKPGPGGIPAAIGRAPAAPTAPAAPAVMKSGGKQASLVYDPITKSIAVPLEPTYSGYFLPKPDTKVEEVKRQAIEEIRRQAMEAIRINFEILNTVNML